MEPSIYYFAYGSNMSIEQMSRRCPDNKKIGLGVVKNYKWIITKRGYANIVQSENDYVSGVVYLISKDDKLSLDQHEALYKPDIVNVHMKTGAISCATYIDPIVEIGMPKAEYIGRMNQGIVHAPLSAKYVDKYIRPFIPSE